MVSRTRTGACHGTAVVQMPDNASLANPTAVHARALYDFAGGSIDEASFSEGDELKVVDQEDASWWKVEHRDSIKIAPATYLEIIG